MWDGCELALGQLALLAKRCIRSHALLGIPARSGCIAWRCKPVLQQRRKQMTSSQRASAAFANQPVAEDADTPAQPQDYVFVDNLRLVWQLLPANIFRFAAQHARCSTVCICLLPGT